LRRHSPAAWRARPVQKDDWGKLYQQQLPGDEPLCMVKVLNATPEPDGTFKEYWLRVPPTMRTAHQAVAWTFSAEAQDYRPAVET
jgi:hypothetical protein